MTGNYDLRGKPPTSKRFEEAVLVGGVATSDGKTVFTVIGGPHHGGNVALEPGCLETSLPNNHDGEQIYTVRSITVGDGQPVRFLAPRAMSDRDVMALLLRTATTPEKSAEVDDDFSFWHRLGLSNPYNKRIDDDVLAVLKAVAVEGAFNDGVAKDLGLPEQYVEMIQTLLCDIGWCEYGTSPRGCWIDGPHPQAVIAWLEADIARRWKS